MGRSTRRVSWATAVRHRSSELFDRRRGRRFRLTLVVDGQRNLVKLQNGRATVQSQTRSPSPTPEAGRDIPRRSQPCPILVSETTGTALDRSVGGKRRALVGGNRLPGAVGAVLRRRRPGRGVAVRQRLTCARVRPRRTASTRLPLPLILRSVEKRLIARGLLAGAIGAVLAFVFARLFAEPVIGRAIAFEDGRTEAEHAQGVHEHGAELFTRGVQSNAGLGFGVLIFGLAMGALFAVAVLRRLCARGWQRQKPCATAAFGAAGGGGVRRGVPGSVPEVSAESAGGRPVRHDRSAHRLVSGDGADVGRAGDRGGVAGPAAGRSSRRVERAGCSRRGLTWSTIVVVMVLLPTVDETPEPLRDASGAIIYPGFPADVSLRVQVAVAGYPAGAVGDHRPGLRDTRRAAAGRAAESGRASSIAA